MAGVDTDRSLFRVILQVVSILLAWLVVITYLHHYIHVHIDLITRVLDTSFFEIGGRDIVVFGFAVSPDPEHTCSA